MPTPARRTWSLYGFLLVAISGVVVLLTALLVGYADRGHRRATVDLARQLVSVSTDSLYERTIATLEPARSSAAMVAALARGRTEPGAYDEALVRAMTALLHEHPHLFSVYVGDEDGSFLQVRREPSVQTPGCVIDREVLVVRRIDWSDGTGRESRRPLSAACGEAEAATEYDPRRRPWYQLARGGAAWTSPYTLYTSKAPGVTAAHPILGPTGAPSGVAAADVTLGALADFLHAQRPSPGGRALVLDEAARVVVSPEGAPDEPWIRRAVERHGSSGETAFFLNHEGDGYLARFAALPEGLGSARTLAVVVPVEDFLRRADSIRATAVLMSFVALLLGLLLAAVIARRVSRPIRQLADGVHRVRRLELDNDFATTSTVREVRELSGALVAMQAALASFLRFVPRHLVRDVMERGEVAARGGEEREVTVLFADIEGYSGIVEQLEPTRVVSMINAWLEVVQVAVDQHGGCLLEVQGDAVLVVFGAPDVQEQHPAEGVRCALAMRKALSELNLRWGEEGLAPVWEELGLQTLSVRAGLHTGRVVAGNLGSDTTMKYGVVGDVVNIAARLETLNKAFGTTVLVSEEVWARLPVALQQQALDRGRRVLRGRERPQRVYSF